MTQKRTVDSEAAEMRLLSTMALVESIERTKWPYSISNRGQLCYGSMGGTPMNLKESRVAYGLSQIDAAKIAGVPVRTFRRYEMDEGYGSPLKRRMFIQLLEEQCEITEEKGVLTIAKIQSELTRLFENKYQGEIDFCYLFGSYAKGKAVDRSDVDLYIVSSLKGLRFLGLAEDIRQALHKKVDVLRPSQLQANVELMNEIMKTGIKIYG
jgi:hypothetical protein